MKIFIIAMIIMISVIGSIIYFSHPAQKATANTIEETGPNTACSSDTQCWCRSFDGSKFIPDEKAPSKCDFGKCMSCFYE